MKKLLPLLLLLCMGLGAQASHLMGGEISVKDLGNSMFEVKITNYRDTMGIPMYQEVDLYVDSFDAATATYYNMGSQTIDLNPAYSLPLLPNFPYGVEVGIYVDTLLLGPGQYRLTSYECCRNAAIINMANPGSEGMALVTDFTAPAVGDTNSSPDFLQMPVTYFPLNTAINYNPVPIDVDGDSLAWSLNVPYGDYSNTNGVDTVAGFVAPSADPSGPFTMNPVTGEITWTPDMLGNFVQSFKIDEYRNGVLQGSVIRDYQYVVINPTGNNQAPPQAVVQSGNVQYNSTDDYYYMEYTPGQLLTFNIVGTDADVNTTLTMTSVSKIFNLNDPATFTTSLIGSNLNGVLNWTPPAGYNEKEIIVFRVQDGTWTTDYTLRLEPKNSNPTGIDNVESSVSQLEVYPNPTQNEFTLSLNNKKSGSASIEIYNHLGQNVGQIFQGDLPSGQWKMQHQEELPAGVYMISVRIEGEQAQTIPLMIK